MAGYGNIRLSEGSLLMTNVSQTDDSNTGIKFASEPEPTEEVVMIDIGRILPHPDNPRGEIEEEDCYELAASIKSTGRIIQPLIVVPFRDAFRAVEGHRRRIAGRLAGLQKLPCIVREMTEEEQFDTMLIVNIQRAALTKVQEAHAFARKRSEGRTVQDIVRATGLTPSYVGNRLALCDLDPSVQRLFDADQLAISAAPLMAQIKDAELQRKIAGVAIHRRLSKAGLEIYIEERINGRVPAKGRRRSEKETPRRHSVGETEVFVRSEALEALNVRGATATFDEMREAFDDVCMDVCPEGGGNRKICEACPVPRFITSVLRRVKSRELRAGAGEQIGEAS